MSFAPAVLTKAAIAEGRKSELDVSEKMTIGDHVLIESDDGRRDLVELDKVRRPATAAENPFASDEEKADRSVMRSWEDSSGQFKVEARMLRIEEGAVVLERDDGRVVAQGLHVPLDSFLVEQAGQRQRQRLVLV